MSGRGVVLVAAFVATLGGCVGAHAGTEGIEAYGSLNKVGMGDVNDSLASFNAQFGTRLARIRNGPGGGAAIRLWPNDRLMLRLGFERLETSTEDPDVRVELDCTAWTLGAVWWFPRKGMLRYGLGGNLGIHVASGAIVSSRADLEVAGNELGGGLTAEAMWPLRGACSAVATAGYRWAGVHGLETDGGPSNLNADWSGPYLRLGLAIDRGE